MTEETPSPIIGERELHRVTTITTPDGEKIKDLTVRLSDSIRENLGVKKH